MGRTIAVLLAAVCMACLPACSQPQKEQAPVQPTTSKKVKLNFDKAANTFHLRVDGGDTVEWSTKVDFPLSSPCVSGDTDIDTCEIKSVTGVFPYTCSGNACPDPEVDVGTDGTKLPPIEAVPPAQPNTAPKAGTSTRIAPTTTRRRPLTVAKKFYFECKADKLAIFPDEEVTVNKDSVIGWTSSGATPERQFTVDGLDMVCRENMINQGQNVCTVTGGAGAYQFTVEAGMASSCGTKKVTGTIVVQ